MCGVLRIGSRRVTSVAGRTDLSLRVDDERSSSSAGLVGDIGLGVRRIQLVIGVRRRIDRAAVGGQFAGTVDELTSVRATIGLEDILGGIRFALKRAALEIGFDVLRTDIVIGYGRVPVAVQEMQLRVTATHHTLLASLVPPAVSPSEVIGTVRRFVGRGGTEQVGEPVIIGTA